MNSSRFAHTNLISAINDFENYEAHKKKLNDIKKEIEKKKTKQLAVIDEKNELVKIRIMNNKLQSHNFQDSEKIIEIQRQNKKMLDKLYDISQGKGSQIHQINLEAGAHSAPLFSPTGDTTSIQNSKMMASKMSVMGATQSQMRSLNKPAQKKEAKRIESENQKIMGRIMNSESTLQMKKAEKDFQKHLKIKNTISKTSKLPVEQLIRKKREVDNQSLPSITHYTKRSQSPTQTRNKQQLSQDGKKQRAASSEMNQAKGFEEEERGAEKKQMPNSKSVANLQKVNKPVTKSGQYNTVGSKASITTRAPPKQNDIGSAIISGGGRAGNPMEKKVSIKTDVVAQPPPIKLNQPSGKAAAKNNSDLSVKNPVKPIKQQVPDEDEDDDYEDDLEEEEDQDAIRSSSQEKMSRFSFAGGFKNSRDEERPDSNIKEVDRVVEKVEEEVDEDYSEVIEEESQEQIALVTQKSKAEKPVVTRQSMEIKSVPGVKLAPVPLGQKKVSVDGQQVTSQQSLTKISSQISLGRTAPPPPPVVSIGKKAVQEKQREEDEIDQDYQEDSYEDDDFA